MRQRAKVVLGAFALGAGTYAAGRSLFPGDLQKQTALRITPLGASYARSLMWPETKGDTASQVMQLSSLIALGIWLFRNSHEARGCVAQPGATVPSPRPQV